MLPIFVSPKLNLNPPESDARMSGKADDLSATQMFFNEAPATSRAEAGRLIKSVRDAGKNLGRSKYP